MRRTSTILLQSLLLFALAGAASSCGPGRGAYCDAKCECEGCSPAGYDFCLSEDDKDYREWIVPAVLVNQLDWRVE